MKLIRHFNDIRKKRTFILGLSTIAVILAQILILQDIGCYIPELQRSLAFAVFLVFLLYSLPLPFKKLLGKSLHTRGSFKLFINLFIILISVLILFYIKQPYIAAGSVPLLLIGVNGIQRLSGIKREENYILLTLSLVTFFTFYSIYSIPPLWHFFQKSSYLVSSLIGARYGPSVSGLYLILPFLILGIILLYKGIKKLYAILFLLSTIVIWIIYVRLNVSLINGFEIDQINTLYILFIAESINAIIFCLLSPINNIPKQRKIFKVKTLYCYIFCITILITIFVSSFMPLHYTEKKEIVIYKTKDMLGDWSKPDYSKFMAAGAGMFGMLPDYMNSLGYSVSMITNSSDLSLIDKHCILVIINPSKDLSDTEKTIILNFVKDGGSLFVLGDHTDVGGIMRPLNNITSYFGIRFNFDATLPSRRSIATTGIWLGCTDLYMHPMCNDLDVGLMEWRVGASLDTSPWVVPVIIGKYALSDHGNYFNEAFLGNYRHDPGEPFGDLVLAAATFYGDGKILVFGDTSSIQNPTLPKSHKFLDRILGWLSSDDNWYKYLVRTISTMLLIFVLIIYVYYLSESEEKTVRDFAIFISALILSSYLSLLFMPQQDIRGENIIYIDASHGEKFNILGFQRGSIGGFMINLMRNNYLPFIFDRFDKKKISISKAVVIISPSGKITQEENDFLKNYMYQGGVVIVSTGFVGKENLDPLLRDMGLDIVNVPLGPVPYAERKNEPKFVDAYKIDVLVNDSVDILYSVSIENKTYPTVVFKKVGEGGFLLISDGRFLLDENIESAHHYKPNNIMFIKDMLLFLKQRCAL